MFMIRRAGAATSAARKKVSYFLADADADAHTPARKARSTPTIKSIFYRDPSLWTTPAPAPGYDARSRLGKPVFFLRRFIRSCFVLTPISLEDDGSFSSKYSIRIIFSDNIPLGLGMFYGCNGLFCYPDPVDNLELFVWNPATLESRKLPDSPHNKAKCDDDGLEKKNTFVATWADPESEDYKVLRFYCYFRPYHSPVAVGPSEVELYSLKTNSWKKVIFSERLAMFDPISRVPRCCINGVLYTAVVLENERQAIISFDFRSEAFSAPLPFPKFGCGESYKLLEYDGQPSLVLCRLEPSLERDGMIILQWALRNGEWVRVAQYDSSSTYELKPLAFARNGKLLLFEAEYMRPEPHSHLMVLDTTTGVLKQLPGLASEFYYQHFDYAQTFVNLRPPSSGEQEEAQAKYLGDFEFLNYFEDEDDDDDIDVMDEED